MVCLKHQQLQPMDRWSGRKKSEKQPVLPFYQLSTQARPKHDATSDCIFAAFVFEADSCIDTSKRQAQAGGCAEGQKVVKPLRGKNTIQFKQLSEAIHF